MAVKDHGAIEGHYITTAFGGAVSKLGCEGLPSEEA